MLSANSFDDFNTAETISREEGKKHVCLSLFYTVKSAEL